MRKLYVCLVVTLLALVACGPTVTPEVIRDFSRANTLTALARPSATPTGPTLTPTLTSTPYTRPTDPPALDLALPIVRVGEETITLGEFRARVRYERFAALDDARRTIEQVGLAQLNMATPGQNKVADALAGVFNTLANSKAFGYQVYDILVRESIIRQEFRARHLSFKDSDPHDYWIRRFGLQRAPDLDAALKQPLEDYLALATRYSGLSREAILGTAESYVMATLLRPIIAKEHTAAPQVVTIKMGHILTNTQADAEAALKQIHDGADFRGVACRLSIDPTARGKGGDLGYITRGGLVAGLENSDQVIQAAPGDIVGPLQSPSGWYIFRVNDKRKNADGDTEVRLQAIVVASQTLATDIKKQAAAGEDFAGLACAYSLDNTGGNGGELGFVGLETLPLEVARAIQATTANGLLGPIQTSAGFEIVQVEDRQVNIPKPADLDQAQNNAFTQWQNEQAASNRVTVLSDSWHDSIPDDPLPRQVAPFMIEENFGLPTPGPTATP
jgi:parvulin-like peptidyl-prolyl isomerase